MEPTEISSIRVFSLIENTVDPLVNSSRLDSLPLTVIARIARNVVRRKLPNHMSSSQKALYVGYAVRRTEMFTQLKRGVPLTEITRLPNR